VELDPKRKRRESKKAKSERNEETAIGERVFYESALTGQITTIPKGRNQKVPEGATGWEYRSDDKGEH